MNYSYLFLCLYSTYLGLDHFHSLIASSDNGAGNIDHTLGCDLIENIGDFSKQTAPLAGLFGSLPLSTLSLWYCEPENHNNYLAWHVNISANNELQQGNYIQSINRSSNIA